MALLKSAAQNLRGKLSGVHYVGTSLQKLIRHHSEDALHPENPLSRICLTMLQNTHFLYSLTMSKKGISLLNFVKVNPEHSLFWHHFQQRSSRKISHAFIRRTAFASQLFSKDKNLWSFYDASGICFYQEHMKPIALSNVDINWIKAQNADKNISISPPRPLFFGGAGVTIRYPLTFKNTKHVGGFLALQISSHTLSQLLKSNMIGSISSLFLMSKEGVCIAHPRLEKSFRVSTKGIQPQRIEHFNKNWKSIFEKRSETPLKGHAVRYKKQAYKLYMTPVESIVKETGFLKDVTLCALLANDYLRSGFEESQQEIFLLSALLLSLVSICILWMSLRMTTPIKQAVYALKQMTHMNFNAHTAKKAYFYEINQILQNIDGMRKALSAFGKFVPKNLVKQLLAEKKPVELGGESKELTVLFSDIKGFTSIAEKLNPQALVQQLCAYFDVMTDIIIDNRGTVDKYIGDAVMAFWGAPIEDRLHVIHACQSALACRDHLKVLNEKLIAEEKDPLYSRFGLATGRVVVGNIGSRERFQYTILGDRVNLASRLESLNKHYGTSILASESVYTKAKDYCVFRIVDRVAVKGKKNGELVYELLGAKDHLSKDHLTYLDDLSLQTERAFHFYQEGDFQRAYDMYQLIFRLFHKDNVASILKMRCAKLKESAQTNWDGIFRPQSK